MSHDRPGLDAVAEPHDDIPAYERQNASMLERRSKLAPRFAQQIALTVAPTLGRPLSECDVVDIGCGYGHAAHALAAEARSVVGIEPSAALAAEADALARGSSRPMRVLHGGHERLLEYPASFDLAVMDNVFEHIPDQAAALHHVSVALRPGGCLYMLVPNRLWPMEVHYHLPGLSWLPVPLANAYLRATGRGEDYTDASYAPTAAGLMALFAEQPSLEARFVLPGDVSLAQGVSPLYRLGVKAIGRWPALWQISKALLVVARRRSQP